MKIEINTVLAIIQIISIAATLTISIFNLIKSIQLARNEQQINILTHKRSVRIDELRQTSSDIISSAEIIMSKNLNDNAAQYELLIKSVNKFKSLLQYIYDKDIELIDMAIEIKKIVMSGIDDAEVGHLKDLLSSFWKKCDLYIGVEFERLKNESKGEFQKVGYEELSFNDVYEKMQQKEQESLQLRKN